MDFLNRIKSLFSGNSSSSSRGNSGSSSRGRDDSAARAAEERRRREEEERRRREAEKRQREAEAARKRAESEARTKQVEAERQRRTAEAQRRAATQTPQENLLDQTNMLLPRKAKQTQETMDRFKGRGAGVMTPEALNKAAQREDQNQLIKVQANRNKVANDAVEVSKEAARSSNPEIRKQAERLQKNTGTARTNSQRAAEIERRTKSLREKQAQERQLKETLDTQVRGTKDPTKTVRLADREINSIGGRTASSLVQQAEAGSAWDQRRIVGKLEKAIKNLNEDYSDEAELERIQLSAALQKIQPRRKKTVGTVGADIVKGIVVDTPAGIGDALGELGYTATGDRQRRSEASQRQANEAHDLATQYLQQGDTERAAYFRQMAEQYAREGQRAIERQIEGSDPIKAAGTVVQAAALPFAYAAGGGAAINTARVGAGRLTNIGGRSIGNLTSSQLAQRGLGPRLSTLMGETADAMVWGVPESAANVYREQGAEATAGDVFGGVATDAAFTAALPGVGYGVGRGARGLRQGAEAYKAMSPAERQAGFAQVPLGPESVPEKVPIAGGISSKNAADAERARQVETQQAAQMEAQQMQAQQAAALEAEAAQAQVPQVVDEPFIPTPGERVLPDEPAYLPDAPVEAAPIEAAPVRQSADPEMVEAQMMAARQAEGRSQQAAQMIEEPAPIDRTPAKTEGRLEAEQVQAATPAAQPARAEPESAPANPTEAKLRNVESDIAAIKAQGREVPEGLTQVRKQLRNELIEEREMSRVASPAPDAPVSKAEPDPIPDAPNPKTEALRALNERHAKATSKEERALVARTIRATEQGDTTPVKAARLKKAEKELAEFTGSKAPAKTKTKTKTADAKPAKATKAPTKPTATKREVDNAMVDSLFEKGGTLSEAQAKAKVIADKKADAPAKKADAPFKPTKAKRQLKEEPARQEAPKDGLFGKRQVPEAESQVFNLMSKYKAAADAGNTKAADSIAKDLADLGRSPNGAKLQKAAPAKAAPAATPAPTKAPQAKAEAPFKPTPAKSVLAKESAPAKPRKAKEAAPAKAETVEQKTARLAKQKIEQTKATDEKLKKEPSDFAKKAQETARQNRKAAKAKGKTAVVAPNVIKGIASQAGKATGETSKSFENAMKSYREVIHIEPAQAKAREKVAGYTGEELVSQAKSIDLTKNPAAQFEAGAIMERLYSRTTQKGVSKADKDVAFETMIETGQKLAGIQSASGQAQRIGQEVISRLPAPFKVAREMGKLIEQFKQLGKEFNPTKADQKQLTKYMESYDKHIATIVSKQDNIDKLMDKLENGQVTDKQVSRLIKQLNKDRADIAKAEAAARKANQAYIDKLESIKPPLTRKEKIEQWIVGSPDHAANYLRMSMLSAPSGRLRDMVSTMLNGIDSLAVSAIEALGGKVANKHLGTNLVDTVGSKYATKEGAKTTAGRVKASYTGDVPPGASVVRSRSELHASGNVDGISIFGKGRPTKPKGWMRVAARQPRNAVRAAVQVATDASYSLYTNRLYALGKTAAKEKGLEGAQADLYARAYMERPPEKGANDAAELWLESSGMHKNVVSQGLSWFADQLDSLGSKKGEGGAAGQLALKALGKYIRTSTIPFVQYTGGATHAMLVKQNAFANIIEAGVAYHNGDMQKFARELSRATWNTTKVSALTGAIYTGALEMSDTDPTGENRYGGPFIVLPNGDHLSVSSLGIAAAAPLIAAYHTSEGVKMAREGNIGDSIKATPMNILWDTLKSAGMDNVLSGENILSGLFNSVGRTMNNPDKDGADGATEIWGGLYGDLGSQAIPAILRDIDSFRGKPLNEAPDTSGKNEEGESTAFTKAEARLKSAIPGVSNTLPRKEGSEARTFLDRIFMIQPKSDAMKEKEASDKKEVDSLSKSLKTVIKDKKHLDMLSDDTKKIVDRAAKQDKDLTPKELSKIRNELAEDKVAHKMLKNDDWDGYTQSKRLKLDKLKAVDGVKDDKSIANVKREIKRAELAKKEGVSTEIYQMYSGAGREGGKVGEKDIKKMLEPENWDSDLEKSQQLVALDMMLTENELSYGTSGDEGYKSPVYKDSLVRNVGQASIAQRDGIEGEVFKLYTGIGMTGDGASISQTELNKMFDDESDTYDPELGEKILAIDALMTQNELSENTAGVSPWLRRKYKEKTARAGGKSGRGGSGGSGSKEPNVPKPTYGAAKRIAAEGPAVKYRDLQAPSSPIPNLASQTSQTTLKKNITVKKGVQL